MFSQRTNVLMATNFIKIINTEILSYHVMVVSYPNTQISWNKYVKQPISKI